ncbi:MAG TPA: ABC transporter ATP-binding protein [Alphaproteobacteria bacterium]|jgi:branched-chain amino acid transport system ATP-binding protein
MSSTPIIAAEDLHVYYGASHILHGVSLVMAPGEAVSLIGRNGMGKTTLLRALSGLTPPRRGKVAVAGVDMTGGPAHRVARAGVAMVPEGRGIFPTLTVREHLVMSARPGPGGRADWTLERILALFPRLAERSRNLGLQLSGGEQQMLSIGRALITNPALLLLDEATEGLAPLVRKEIWAVIRAVKAAGVATLVVDKDIRALAAVTDRSIVLAKGRVVYEGKTADLAARPELLNRYLGVGAELVEAGAARPYGANCLTPVRA